MSTVSARPRVLDPTIYPTEERVGESMLQRRIAELLRPLLEWWLNVRRGRVAFVGADQFIYWRQYDPHARVAPDVYVIPGVEPGTAVKSWKLWIDKVVPSIAVEIVSDEWEKDYVEAPLKYEQLGVAELIIFDPASELSGERVRFQVYRRVGRRGLVRVEVAAGDRVRSRALGCWLRALGEGTEMRLRIAEGPRGEGLVPTAEERGRAAEERKRAAEERERAAEERERAEREQKEAALAKVAELERQLRRFKQGRSRS